MESKIKYNISTETLKKPSKVTRNRLGKYPEKTYLPVF